MKTHQFKTVEELNAHGGPQKGDRLMPFGWAWSPVHRQFYGPDKLSEAQRLSDAKAMIRDSKGTVYIERDVEEPRVWAWKWQAHTPCECISGPMIPAGTYRALVFPADSPVPPDRETWELVTALNGEDSPDAQAWLDARRGLVLEDK